MKSEEKIWYGCYGSNLLEERFLCYIRGGRPWGSTKVYSGCRNRDLPTDSEDFYIPSELYFAKESPAWENGGVAFIRTVFAANASTLGRIYLISKDQLVDIARQETNTIGDLVLDFDEAKRRGSSRFKRPSWYGNLVYLGEHNGYSIYTLTNEIDMLPITKPSHDYLRTIINGIRESHAFDDQTIFEYLRTKRGIIGNFYDEELLGLFNVSRT